MAIPNGLSPVISGPVTAQGYRNLISTGLLPQKIIVFTNGTTAVNVFGTTNGFSGTVVSVKTMGKDATDGAVSLKQNIAGVESLVAKIAKGTAPGGFVGSFIGTVGTAFTASGTMTVVSSTAGDAIVEIDFIIATPEKP